MVRSMNQLHIVRYLKTSDHDSKVDQLSSEDRWERSVKRISYSNNTFENEGKLLIEDGFDTSLASNGFIIESQTNQSVDDWGFTDSVKVERLPIVSAITALDLEDELVLLEQKECITMKNNQVSILSTFQAREAGVIVYDIAKRYNGQQNIKGDGYKLPLM